MIIFHNPLCSRPVLSGRTVVFSTTEPVTPQAPRMTVGDLELALRKRVLARVVQVAATRTRMAIDQGEGDAVSCSVDG